MNKTNTSALYVSSPTEATWDVFRYALCGKVDVKTVEKTANKVLAAFLKGTYAVRPCLNLKQDLAFTVNIWNKKDIFKLLSSAERIAVILALIVAVAEETGKDTLYLDGVFSYVDTKMRERMTDYFSRSGLVLVYFYPHTQQQFFGTPPDNVFFVEMM